MTSMFINNADAHRCRVRNECLRIGRELVTVNAFATRLRCDCGNTVIWINSVQSLATDNYPDVASAEIAGWQFDGTAIPEETYTCDACAEDWVR